MTAPFSFTLKARDGNARAGAVATPRGVIRTPAFMPVGTGATVKAMFPEDVAASGADIILANTYHLMLRPGAERIAKLGGLHQFMHWERPILTDSGGSQVMSLAKLRRIDEQGVTFQSHIDGATVELTPERAIEIQTLLDSDIIMQLDECIKLPNTPAELERAMRLSLAWASAASAPSKARRPAARCSASCRAATILACAGVRPRGSRPSALPVMPWAGWRSGNRRR